MLNLKQLDLDFFCFIIFTLKLSIMSLRLFLLVFPLILFSCKDDNVSPEEEGQKTEQLHVELVEKEVTTSELYPDEENFENIYPGSILNLKSNGQRLVVSKFKDFNPLPVRIISINSKDNTEIIPSFNGTQEFLKGIEKTTNSLTGSSHFWSKIVDYRTLLNIQMLNSDLIGLFKLLDNNEHNYIIKHAKTTLVGFAKVIDNEIIMEIPKKTELLTDEEWNKLKEKNLHYISSVSYGINYIKIVESDLPEDDIKSAFNKLNLSKTLTEDDIKVIDNSTMTLLLRTSAYKSPLLKKAKGYKEIEALSDEVNNMLSSSACNHSYPIYYHSRSLNEFSKFSHTYSNQFYAEK